MGGLTTGLPHSRFSLLHVVIIPTLEIRAFTFLEHALQGDLVLS